MASAVTLPLSNDLSFVVVLQAAAMGGNARYVLSGGNATSVTQVEITSDGRFGFAYGGAAGFGVARALTGAGLADGAAKALLCTYDKATKMASISSERRGAD